MSLGPIPFDIQSRIDMITCAHTELSILTICLFFIRFSVIYTCVWCMHIFFAWPKFRTHSFTLYHPIVIPTSAKYLQYSTSKPVASVIFATHSKNCVDQFLQRNSQKTDRFFCYSFDIFI